MKVLIMNYCADNSIATSAVKSLQGYLNKTTPIIGVDYLSLTIDDIQTVYKYSSFDINNESDYKKLNKAINLIKIAYSTIFIESNIINNILVIKLVENKGNKKVTITNETVEDLLTSMTPIKPKYKSPEWITIEKLDELIRAAKLSITITEVPNKKGTLVVIGSTRYLVKLKGSRTYKNGELV